MQLGTWSQGRLKSALGKTAKARPQNAVDTLVESACLLGEGPLWCTGRDCLFWVDIEGQRLWSWSAARGARSLPLPGAPGFLAHGPRGLLVTGIARGFALIDPLAGTVRSLADPQLLAAGTRFNDGKADRLGAVVAGGAHLAETAPEASAYRLGAAGPTSLPGRFTVFNGPAFSPDGRRIYFTDSPSKVIRTASYDPESGLLGRVEDFVRLPASSGYPDGMTVDSAGGLWNAEWDGWQVTRYHPSGARDRSIALPVPRPTSLTFGGPAMDRLFVTSARSRLDSEALAEAPLSGALFGLTPGERGLPEVEAKLDLPPDPWVAAP